MGFHVGRAIPADITAPAPPFRLPDFSVCSESYGEHLDTLSCYQAADQIPEGTLNRTFDLSRLPNNLPPFYALPFSIQEGSCYISVEAAGPSYPTTIDIPPDDLRILAAQTIQRCVFRNNGVGGFGTYRFENMFNFLAIFSQSPRSWPPPASTIFITLTVSGSHGKLTAPGDTDPEIPERLGNLIIERSQAFSATKSWSAFHAISQYLHIMNRKGGPWWGSPFSRAFAGTLLDANDKMTYECDANLGNPIPGDCSHLEYAELGPDSDTLHVGPGATTFLHQGSCAASISSSIPMVLTWQQIRLAVSALIGVCVLDPMNGAQGGRAFYGKPGSLVIEGRRKRKRKHNMKKEMKEKEERMKRDLSGFNALPPHANVTIFHSL